MVAGRLRELSSLFKFRRCALCQGTARGGFLCDDCLSRLPRVLDRLCPMCAGPLAPGSQCCSSCAVKPRRYDRTFAAFHYESPMDRLLLVLKFQRKADLAAALAREILAGCDITGDVVVPVPLFEDRLRQRGANHAAEIARHVAQELRLPMLPEGCKRVRDTQSQNGLSSRERRENLHHAFSCKLDLREKSVIVVDDMMASGATLNEMARALKRRGAVHITNLVVARAAKP